MLRMSSEEEFQMEVMRMLSTYGHVQDHRLSSQSHVPDMSAAFSGWDYWFELKFGLFKFGHDKYDDLTFKETTRGQLDWLIRRALAGDSICGILGYMRSLHVDYVCFFTAEDYMRLIWNPAKKLCVGAAVLGGWADTADSIRSADDLLTLVHRSAQRDRRLT